MSLWAVVFQGVDGVDDHSDGGYYSYDEEDHRVGPGCGSEDAAGVDECSAGHLEDVEGCYLEDVCH